VADSEDGRRSDELDLWNYAPPWKDSV